MDINDPADGGPGTLLYTVEMFETIKTRLNQDGIFVTQTGPASMNTVELSFLSIFAFLTFFIFLIISKFFYKDLQVNK